MHKPGFSGQRRGESSKDVNTSTLRGDTVNPREQLIMVLRAERTRKKQTRVEELVVAGQCLGTTRDGSKCEQRACRRGLCWSCYRQYLSQTRGLSQHDAAAYEARLISAGAILADREIERIKDRSVFKRLA
jgi:hypothetical protein